MNKQMKMTNPDIKIITGYQVFEGDTQSLVTTGSEFRGFMLRIRLTESEHTTLQAKANSAGQTMSEYARQRIFGNA